MKRTIKWLVVLSLLALPVFTAVARAPRPPRPVLTCDPDSIHSLRDLVWYTRHCRTRIVQEAEVTSSGNTLPTATGTPTRDPCGKQVWNCSCGYPCPWETDWVPTATRTPGPTRTPTMTGTPTMTHTPTWTPKPTNTPAVYPEP